MNSAPVRQAGQRVVQRGVTKLLQDGGAFGDVGLGAGEPIGAPFVRAHRDPAAEDPR